MKNIVLVSCVSRKLTCKTKAKDLYISPLFKFNLKYAFSLNPDKVFILSAKYGLLDLEEEIEPYNKTLNNMSSKEVKDWAKEVINSLMKSADIKKDNFIFLAGERYRRYLLPYIGHYEIPLKNLGIGKQLKYLKDKIKNE